jgi:hypothetical protein
LHVMTLAGAAVALAVVVLRGVVVRRRVLEAVYFDADIGRMRSLASSPRRIAEWLVLHHPQAVRLFPQPFCFETLPAWLAATEHTLTCTASVWTMIGTLPDSDCMRCIPGLRSITSFVCPAPRLHVQGLFNAVGASRTNSTRTY